MRGVSRFAAFLFALFALAWPTLVASNHHHLGPIPAATGGTAMAAAVTGDPATPDTPDGCAICQQVAHAGTLLLLTPATLPAPVADARTPVAATVGAVFVAGRSSHTWRSRAPPPLRQA